jgi:hypothetical protein
MLQTDTLEAQQLNEQNTFDSYQDLEDLSVVAYPTTTTSDKLRFNIQNKGDIEANIVRIWIKDQYYNISSTVEIGETQEIGPITVTLVQNTSYPIKVITERGNVYTSDAGNIIFSSDGLWYTPSLGVNVYISNDKGKYYVKVYNSTWFDEYETQGQDFGDITILFEVDTLGTYDVICKKNSENGPDLPGTPVEATISWPNGSPIVYVYTSGLDT